MRSIVAMLILASASAAHAEAKYYGIYVNGTKTGYSFTVDSQDEFEGRQAIRSDGHWENLSTASGVTTKQVVDTTSWASLDNKPLRDTVTANLGGRVIQVEAVFRAKTVEIDLEAGGKKSHQSVPLPDGPIFEDMERVIHEKVPNSGQQITYWAFEPGIQVFEKLELKTVGTSRYTAGGLELSARLTEVNISTQGFTNHVFTNPEGNIVREEFPVKTVVQAEPQEIALAKPDRNPTTTDVMILSSLKADKPIRDANRLTEVKLRISGMNLSAIPSDPGQTVSKDAEAWVVDVHPARSPGTPGKTISEVASDQPGWVKPTAFMPSDNVDLRDLASKLVRKKKTVTESAEAIKEYVTNLIKPDPGIRVSRDAVQILQEKRGKCTDYAILTTTLLRAAGIPARVASGLVTTDGTFYYHAWSEYWDGNGWIGMDSVFPEIQLSACHVKLAQGNVDDGFNLTFSDPATVTVTVLKTER